jgi:cytochrome c oxidase subunit 2
MVKIAAVVTAVVIFLIVLITLIIGKSASEKKDGVQTGLYKIRTLYFYFLIVAIIGVLFITLKPGAMPYTQLQSGEPELIVNVTAKTFSWDLSTNQIPENKLIEFAVQSEDVTHGFGIYSPEGKILAQTQVMPGYTNRLRYTFTTPGTYKIMCMEYCGVSHHNMMYDLNVGPVSETNAETKKTETSKTGAKK